MLIKTTFTGPQVYIVHVIEPAHKRPAVYNDHILSVPKWSYKCINDQYIKLNEVVLC